MLKSKPLLSICIPTYNRSEYLKKSLNSLFLQSCVDWEQVEIVVSDNASTDNTQVIIEEYSKKFTNFVYNKNNENITDRNFSKVINLACGEFRKLFNDTAIYADGSITFLLETICQNLEEKPILFFLNGSNRNFSEDVFFGTGLNSFLEKSSYWSTWIGCFGIWEKDFFALPDKESGSELCLWQTSVLFENLHRNQKFCIYNKVLVKIQIIEKKNLKYGLKKVFYDNYLSLIHKYVGIDIAENTFMNERKTLLFDFFLPWTIPSAIEGTFVFNENDSLQLIKEEYKHDPYWIHFVLARWKTILKIKIKRILYSRVQ